MERFLTKAWQHKQSASVPKVVFPENFREFSQIIF